MPNKKDNLKKIFTQILEPFALGILALLFILPVITVMNLTPITKQLKKLDVLGVTSQADISVSLVEGKHEVFTNENLNKLENNKYNYSVSLNKRASDSYSKPILEIENKGGEIQKISFWGQTLSNTRSEIYLIVNNETYKIQDGNGETFTQEITINSSEKNIIFLSVENLSGVQFTEMFDMNITILENSSEGENI